MLAVGALPTVYIVVASHTLSTRNPLQVPRTRREKQVCLFLIMHFSIVFTHFTLLSEYVLRHIWYSEFSVLKNISEFSPFLSFLKYFLGGPFMALFDKTAWWNAFYPSSLFIYELSSFRHTGCRDYCLLSNIWNKMAYIWKNKPQWLFAIILF